MSNTSVIDLVERTTKEFTRIEQNLPLRKAGLDRFIGIGYPTTNDEDWRFTSLKPFTDLPFKPMIEPTNQAIEKSIIDGITFGEQDTDRLVFVDGHLSSELSQISKQSEGVTVSNLGSGLHELEDKIGEIREKLENPNLNSFVKDPKKLKEFLENYGEFGSIDKWLYNLKTL